MSPTPESARGAASKGFAFYVRGNEKSCVVGAVGRRTFSMTNDIASRLPSVRDFFGRFFTRPEQLRRKGSLDVSSPVAPVRERVLLIGDSTAMLALYAALIRDHSRAFECHLSKDNTNAVGLQLLPSSLPFDFIILDWRAKGSGSTIQTGHDMLLTLRRLSHTRNLPISVIIDGGNLQMDQDWEARTHGATDCFPRTKSTRDLIKWMPGLAAAYRALIAS